MAKPCSEAIRTSAFLHWTTWLLGETLCRGQSPESDTKCRLEQSDGGFIQPPLGVY